MAAGAALVLAGCSSIAGDPVKTSVPHDVPYDMRAKMVAVCYSTGVSAPEQVATAAAELCKEPDTPVELWRDDLVFNDCPLFKKRRAVFACKAPK
ncbi:unnamed protein product [marine sediment metagenome]|uniref:Lipoprotein n=1 Tax=marine sediment metagenome TaxID=412755 RepID=X0UIN8_9ZZZZ